MCSCRSSETPSSSPCQAGPQAWLSLVDSHESPVLLPPRPPGHMGLRRRGDQHSMTVPTRQQLHSHHRLVHWLLCGEPHQGDFRDVRGSTGWSSKRSRRGAEFGVGCLNPTPTLPTSLAQETLYHFLVLVFSSVSPTLGGQGGGNERTARSRTP